MSHYPPGGRRGPESPTIAARFWKYTDKRGPDECWPWKGGVSDGYGLIWTGGKPYQQFAHRVSLSLHGIKPPANRRIVVVRRCKNQLCVNPAHLQFVRRYDIIAAIVAGTPPITHCKRGHEFTAENTRLTPKKGHRVCRTCRHDSYIARKSKA